MGQWISSSKPSLQRSNKLLEEFKDAEFKRIDRIQPVMKEITMKIHSADHQHQRSIVIDEVREEDMRSTIIPTLEKTGYKVEQQPNNNYRVSWD